MNDPQKLQALASQIGLKLNEIHRLFNQHVELTLVVRCPTSVDHDRDLYLSNDDAGKVKDVIDWFNNAHPECYDRLET